MRRVKMLQHFGVTPYLVFDGGYLPSKAHTEASRAKRREEAMAAGRAFQAKGNRKAAQEQYSKAIDVTPAMALQFIRALQEAKVQYVVAPYEADAQLAYLEKQNIIHGIITEDSDLLVFGCNRVLFKLNEFGDCLEISRDRLGRNLDLPMAGWSADRFRWMAILSGCDYLARIPGMGLKRAYRLVKKQGTLPAIFKALRMDAGLRMPANYEAQFVVADETFQFQRVYCPDKRKVIMWNNPGRTLNEATEAHIGEQLEDGIAQQIATGVLDPMTKRLISLDTANPLKTKVNNAASGTRSIKSFLINQKELEETASPLQDIQPNILDRRRPAPLTLREKQRAKKLKLFETSPSPESLKNASHPANWKLVRPPVPASISACTKPKDKENQISPFFAKQVAASTIRKNTAVKAASAAGSSPTERFFDSDPDYERALAEALDASAQEAAEREASRVAVEQEQARVMAESAAMHENHEARLAEASHVPEDTIVTPAEQVASPERSSSEAWKAAFSLDNQIVQPIITTSVKSQISRSAPFFTPAVQPVTRMCKTTAYFVQPSETRKTFPLTANKTPALDLSRFKYMR
jgi:5'-3' exonuclease